MISDPATRSKTEAEIEDQEDERIYALGCKLELAQTIVGYAFSEVQTRMYELKQESPRNAEYIARLRQEADKLFTLKTTFRITNMEAIENALRDYQSYCLPQP